MFDKMWKYNRKMKVVLLVDSSRYSYHRTVIDDVRYAFEFNTCDCAEISVIDFAEDGPRYLKYSAIVNYSPDLIINLDFVGFVLKSEGKRISLNNINCRIANLLFKNTDSYRTDINYRQNLSMFTYFSYGSMKNEDVNSEIYKNPNIPNPGIMCEYDYNASSEEDKRNNRNRILAWIDEMLNEVMKMY